MKRVLMLLFLAAAVRGADEAKAVEEAERGWARGVTGNDFALLERVLAPELSYTHSNGASDTKESYIGNLKSGKARYLNVEYEKIQVRMLSKDVAITLCRANLVTLQNGRENPVKLSMLHVFRKSRGQWQLVAHQSARVQ